MTYVPDKAYLRKVRGRIRNHNLSGEAFLYRDGNWMAVPLRKTKGAK